jgi:hypothetical protein
MISPGAGAAFANNFIVLLQTTTSGVSEVKNVILDLTLDCLDAVGDFLPLYRLWASVFVPEETVVGHWLVDRHRFTSRAFHSQRPSLAKADRQEQWRNRIEEPLRIVPHDRILNTDETSWLLWPRWILRRTDLNADHAPIVIRGDEKENLTVLATINT